MSSSRNLLVLFVVALAVSSAVANKGAFVNSNPGTIAMTSAANIQKEQEHHQQQQGHPNFAKEILKPMTKENIAHVHKLTHKLMKKSNKSPFVKRTPTTTEAIAAKQAKEKKPFDRKVQPEIHMESTSSSADSGMAANKVMVRMKYYSGSNSCDESNLYTASGMLANACLLDDQTFTEEYSWGTSTYSTKATSLSALKTTHDGVSYGTAIQTYFSYSDCYYPDYNSREISDTYMLDHCYGGYDSTEGYYSYKVSFTNDMSVSVGGVYMNEYQGVRACNSKDTNGIKSFAFFPSYKCIEDEDNGGSMMFYCSWGNPTVATYTDSSCSSGYYESSYQLNTANCYDSDNKFNVYCN